MEEYHSLIVVGFDAEELIGSAAYGRNGDRFGHDDTVGVLDIVSSDRFAIGPIHIVAHHHFIVEAVVAALPAYHSGGSGEVVEFPIEPEQSGVGKPSNVKLSGGANQ